MIENTTVNQVYRNWGLYYLNEELINYWKEETDDKNQCIRSEDKSLKKSVLRPGKEIKV